MVDFFSNVPDIVIDKILENLPIRVAAQTSVLSKRWGHAWLSLEHLIFDSDFQEQQKNKDGSCNWRKSSRIISSILLNHNGHVHDFNLDVPNEANDDHIYLSQWISFLSRNGVQKIVIDYKDYKMHIPSSIFRCSDLVYLDLSNFSLNSPPTCFHGFPKLKHLGLADVEFTKENMFCSLIEKCKMLVTLILVDCIGMDHVVIDAPSLQTFIFVGDFEYLAFRNVCSLKNVYMYLRTMPKKLVTAERVDVVNLLASACQLQSIEFNGYMSKFLAAGGIRRSASVTFNHIHDLCLCYLNLSDFGVFHYLLSMIECCPCIKTLDISVTRGENVVQGIFDDLNYKYKLDHLREVSIEGITGSSAELKLVEYLLAISASLENLFFKSGECSIESELEMSRTLMRFPRASSKASVVYLGKYAAKAI